MRKVAFSPNGKYLATVGSDDTARVWEVTSGREVVRLKQNRVFNVAFSPDSKYLVTAGLDDTARVWEVTSDREVAQLRHRGEVVKDASGSKIPEGELKVTFNSNGKYLVTYGRYNTALVWEVVSGREVVRLKHQNYFAGEFAFSADSKYLFKKYSGNLVADWLWEVSSGRESVILKHDGKVVTFASPGGKHLAMASNSAGGTVHVWDATSGRQVARVKLGIGQGQLIAVSPDGKYLVTGTNSTNRVWQTNSGREVARVVGAGQDAIFSANGKFLVTGDHNSPVWVWAVTSSYEVAQAMKHEDSVKAVVFSPDGKYLATTTEDKTVWVWSATSGREITRLKHGDSVVSIAFSRDGKYLATASWDGTARVWETTSGREITRIITEEAATLSTIQKFRQPSGYGFSYENTLAFSPDGKYLVKARLDKTVRMWEVSSGREVMRVKNDAPHIVKLNKLDPPGLSAVTFSPDGRYLAAITNGYWKSKQASSDSKEASSVRVWEVNSGREVAHMNYNSSHVKTITFSPDGRYLAALTSRHDGPTDSNVWLWETASGRKIAPMQYIQDAEYLVGYPSDVKIIAFSPDGRYLAGTGTYRGKTTWVWEATSGRGVAYMSHEDSVNAIAFSPDGKYLATASNDKTARVWQIPNSRGREVTQIINVNGKDFQVQRTIGVREAVEAARITHKDNVVAVAFSPEGKYLATASNDKTAQVQLWQREDLMAEACARLTRNLAEYEWKLYLPGEPYHKTCPNLPVPQSNDVPELR